jgi:hypothetical protein
VINRARVPAAVPPADGGPFAAGGCVGPLSAPRRDGDRGRDRRSSAMARSPSPRCPSVSVCLYGLRICSRCASSQDPVPVAGLWIDCRVIHSLLFNDAGIEILGMNC